ncbi:MAG TPA: hypothetical protein VIQ48_09125 [Rhodanobacter sp.]
MNPIDDDTLQAYVDGELDAAGVARVDAALAHDAVLARRVRQARVLREQVRAAFDPILDEPIPEHLSALLQPGAPPVATVAIPRAVPADRRTSGPTRRRTTRRWFVPSAALAASVAMLAIGLWWHAGNDLVRVQGGQSFAAGDLSTALDQALASEPRPGSTVVIGLSFRAADGHVCRTFVHHPKPTFAGLACHDADGWLLPVLSTAVEPAGGELRQAASALPPEVQAAVDARLRGAVFDAQQERAARDAGWR